MRLFRIRRAAVVPALAISAVGGMICAATPSQAGVSGPSVTFWPAPVPILGSVLSNSSNTASFSMKYGWQIYDPNAVCSAYTNQLYPSVARVWTYGASGADTVTGKYQFTTAVNQDFEFDTTATDCLGNSNSAYGWTQPTMEQQGAADYSTGWTSGSCACWSGGSVMKSSSVGAKANYTFYGRLVSLVSDKATNRGSAAVYIDGVYKKTVTLTAGTTTNRVIVWNSGYLSSGNHVLTVKVASGRVDIDAFLTE